MEHHIRGNRRKYLPLESIILEILTKLIDIEEPSRYGRASGHALLNHAGELSAGEQ